MKLSESEGVSGQLYWEAQIAGNVLFPEGVKMLVGQFEQLFGTPTGMQLRHLAKQNGWVLGWALGFVPLGSKALGSTFSHSRQAR